MSATAAITITDIDNRTYELYIDSNSIDSMRDEQLQDVIGSLEKQLGLNGVKAIAIPTKSVKKKTSVKKVKWILKTQYGDIIDTDSNDILDINRIKEIQVNDYDEEQITNFVHDLFRQLTSNEKEFKKIIKKTKALG